jgi:ribosomal protein S12 methylthiotransferase accessory factor
MLTKKGYNVYIRDVSFTGFPSYRIYIPGLSEVNNLDQRHLAFLKKNKRLRKIILTLATATDDEIAECAMLVEELIQLELWKYQLLEQRTGFLSYLSFITLKSDSHFNHLEPTYLLALLYHRLDDYPMAYKHFRAYLSHNSETLENMKYANCALTYFRLKAHNCTDPEIEHNLQDLFGHDTAREVVADLRDPKQSFAHLVLPHCGDCKRCPVSSECCYPAWSRVNDNIKRMMAANRIDQQRISAYIA